jgi:hypothetical protein
MTVILNNRTNSIAFKISRRDIKASLMEVPTKKPLSGAQSGADNLPRPGLKKSNLQRSTSLPSKLEQAPPTIKLFWFRPNNAGNENEVSRPMRRKRFSASRAALRASSKPLPTIYDDDVSGHTEEDEDELLVGLSFLEDREEER